MPPARWRRCGGRAGAAHRPRRPAGALSLEAEVQGAPRGAQPGRDGIVRVQDRPVALRLIADDVLFGGRVLVHRSMAVQVIGGNVGDGRDRRAGFERLQLKAAQLQDHPVTRADLIEPTEQRNTDVAADERGPTSRLEDLAHQSRSRGLAARTSDADDGGRAALEEEASAGRKRHAPAPRLGQRRNVGRNAWAHVDHLGV